MTMTRISTTLLFTLSAAGVALASPEVWQGSFAFAGGDAEAQARDAALEHMRSSDQEKLPFGAAIPRSLDVVVEGGSMTIRTESGSWSGPYDGTLFAGQSATGIEGRIARTVVDQGEEPATIVESWKVPQRKQGRSMVRSLFQETSYALSADGTTLTVSVRIEGGRLRETVAYTLTYKRN